MSWKVLKSTIERVAILAAATLLVACATNAGRAAMAPRMEPARRFLPDYEHVPAPAAEVPPGIHRGWLALRAGDLPAARAALTALPPAETEGAGARTLRGFILLAGADLPAARMSFEQALAGGSDDSRALYGLGFVAEAERNRAAALDSYRRAVAEDPTLSQAAVRLEVLELEEAQASIARAEEAAEVGDTSSALAAYTAALELAPQVLEPYLRIAEIWRREGDLPRAVDILRTARSRTDESRAVLEPLGRALQESGAHAEAYDVFQSLEMVAPEDPEVRALVAAARDLYMTTSLPQPYLELERKPVIAREDLAALLAIRLPSLGDRVADPRRGVIMTDIDASWAEPYIRQVVEWGVMRPFQNHAFAPELEVTRQSFAEIAYRVLELVGATDRAPRAELRDVPPEHYFYDQLQVVAGYEILRLGPRNSFGILDKVSGPEAFAAVQQLVRIARESDW